MVSIDIVLFSMLKKVAKLSKNLLGNSGALTLLQLVLVMVVAMSNHSLALFFDTIIRVSSLKIVVLFLLDQVNIFGTCKRYSEVIFSNSLRYRLCKEL